jgi:hypothetical protein
LEPFPLTPALSLREREKRTPPLLGEREKRTPPLLGERVGVRASASTIYIADGVPTFYLYVLNDFMYLSRYFYCQNDYTVNSLNDIVFVILTLRE